MEKNINREGVSLIQGNCLDKMKLIPDSHVDLTVTSPPYDNLRTYNGNNSIWCESLWKGIIEEIYRVTSEGGVVIWIVGDATLEGSETGTSFKQALWAMEVGFRLHDTMIWDKGGFSAVGALKTRYAPVFEYMFVFSKGKPKTFNPIKDRKNKHFGKTINKSKRQPDGSVVRGKPYVASEYGQRYNIWTQFPQGNKTGHPAPFPLKLVEDHITSWSNEYDIVFDPFMGSGTTGLAAKRMNRNFIGIELDQDYFTISTNLLLEGEGGM